MVVVQRDEVLLNAGVNQNAPSSEETRWLIPSLIHYNQRARLKRQYKTEQTVAIMPSAIR